MLAWVGGMPSRPHPVRGRLGATQWAIHPPPREPTTARARRRARGQPRMNRIDAALAFVYVASVSALAVALQAPPSVVPATAPPGEFSAERAMAHVRAIAAKPHPTGSPAVAEARAYVVAALTRMGIEPEIVRSTEDPPGREPDGHDPRHPPERPGASAVRALRLAARGSGGGGTTRPAWRRSWRRPRALKASGLRLRNDVILLFTDGEEQGLAGARAFVLNSRHRRPVGLALNFEGRGQPGAVLPVRDQRRQRLDHPRVRPRRPAPDRHLAGRRGLRRDAQQHRLHRLQEPGDPRPELRLRGRLRELPPADPTRPRTSTRGASSTTARMPWR